MTGRSEAWLRQANSDLQAARCTSREGFHSQACFLAGQAAEKALKDPGRGRDHASPANQEE